MSDNKPLCGIYSIKNKDTGKIYIGRSKDMFKRWYKHIGDIQRQGHLPLYQDMKTHGLSAFNFSIVEICGEDVAKYREAFWIIKLNTLHPSGYNLQISGLPKGKTGRTIYSLCVKHGNNCYTKDGLCVLCRKEKWKGIY